MTLKGWRVVKPQHNQSIWHHSDKTSMAIKKRYLDFVQMHGLISLVNDIHMDNLKEILVYVDYGWIINNQPKIVWLGYP